ncbi:LacI family transcriptional regulator [Psychromarinibacter sp. C21-152]|uniref:LacI family transcriptional regulator n=1 Tax=Psychromarinibacter sediminicola TaxID=3033385 RepID=A0AAE3NTB5_9RHOB|nr:LacI family transcriptional regulator [Psychromarinibacter sediminicola]MDF0601676.1 LacI family transcriptional regulator [Psychromarinibacter sediminicola]
MATGDRKQPTLRTISELSGLAVPTVSRALHDAPDIGAETKARVKRIAREIGYVPNRAGVRLKTGKTNVISLILSTEHEILNHTARMISAIAGGLKGTRYHLIVTPYRPSEDPMIPVRYIVETGSADAVILNQIEPQDARLRYLLDRGFPFATHGRSVWSDRHAYFDFDNFAYARLGVSRLAQEGRRNVMVVAPPMAQNYAQEIRAGIEAAAAAAGIAAAVMPDATSDDSAAEISQATATWLARHPGTDGVLCASMTAAMAVVAALEARGRVIGRDVDLVSKEPANFLQLFRPPILAVSEDVNRAGAFLARAAIRAVEAPDEPPLQDMEVPDETSFRTGMDFLKPAS